MTTDVSKLMIVEDNPNDFHFLERIINKEKLDMTYTWLKDGEVAMDWFFHKMTKKPTLILLDVKLPKMNGLEILKALKQCAETQNIPVLMFSTSGQKRDIDEAYRLGANSYIVKPSNYLELKDLLKNIYQYWFVHNETIN